MPRPRPPRLQRIRNRHGNVRWYVRLDDQRRTKIQLHAEYGTPEFDAEYQAAIAGAQLAPKAGCAAAGSLAWLWACYRETAVWATLSPATKRQRENTMARALKAGGAAPCNSIDRTDITAAMDDMAATPHQAQHFLKVMRGLFKWATAAGHVKVDHTATVTGVRSKDVGGHAPWTESDIDAYQAKWPIPAFAAAMPSGSAGSM
jgi:hypothetical protein